MQCISTYFTTNSTFASLHDSQVVNSKLIGACIIAYKLYLYAIILRIEQSGFEPWPGTLQLRHPAMD